MGTNTKDTDSRLFSPPSSTCCTKNVDNAFNVGKPVLNRSGPVYRVAYVPVRYDAPRLEFIESSCTVLWRGEVHLQSRAKSAWPWMWLVNDSYDCLYHLLQVPLEEH